MANKKNKNKANGDGQATLDINEALQASRKEKSASLAQEMLGKNPQKLAQEMLGKRRSSTPRMAPASGSMASRVGVTKRSNSLPRPSSTAPRNPRQPSQLSRPPITDTYQAREPAPRTYSQTTVKGNARPGQEASAGDGLSIRGAASGPYIVRAQNFAPGTTAADIESVMQSVGGAMNYCKLIAAAPTVVAEMSFVERSGAQDVIKMFNGKKADGRTLYVYMQNEHGISAHANGDDGQQVPGDEPLPAVVDTVGDVAMEVDEHADARAAEDRQREERRREPRSQNYPTGPSQPRSDYSRRALPDYQDGRYGFGNGRYGGGGGGGRGYGMGPRMYSDRMGRSGGQSWRP